MRMLFFVEHYHVLRVTICRLSTLYFLISYFFIGFSMLFYLDVFTRFVFLVSLCIQVNYSHLLVQTGHVTDAYTALLAKTVYLSRVFVVYYIFS